MNRWFSHPPSGGAHLGAMIMYPASIGRRWPIRLAAFGWLESRADGVVVRPGLNTLNAPELWVPAHMLDFAQKRGRGAELHVVGHKEPLSVGHLAWIRRGGDRLGGLLALAGVPVRGDDALEGLRRWREPKRWLGLAFVLALLSAAFLGLSGKAQWPILLFLWFSVVSSFRGVGARALQAMPDGTWQRIPSVPPEAVK